MLIYSILFYCKPKTGQTYCRYKNITCHMTDEHTHTKSYTAHVKTDVCTRTTPTHTAIQVIVHYGLPGPTWAYTHGKEVVILWHFLNTNSSCVHTHTYTHKGYTHTNHPRSSHVHSPSKEEVVFSHLIQHTQS